MKQVARNGQKLKQFRKKNGFTQSDIANILGKHNSVVSKYELGTLSIPESVITILNERYNIGLKSTKKSIQTTARTIKEEVIAQSLEQIEALLAQVSIMVEDLKHYCRESR